MKKCQWAINRSCCSMKSFISESLPQIKNLMLFSLSFILVMYKRGPVKKVTLQINFATMTVTKWSLPIPRLQRKRSWRQPLVMELRRITTFQEDLDSLYFLLVMPSWGGNTTEKVPWTQPELRRRAFACICPLCCADPWTARIHLDFQKDVVQV